MKRLAMGLAMALLVIGIVAVHLWRELHGERQRTTELAARIATLESARATPISIAEAARPILDVGAASPAAGSTAPATQPERSEANIFLAAREQMLGSPEGREFALTVVRMGLEQQYPDVAKELGLGADEVERLFDLLAKHAIEAGPDLAKQQMGATGDQVALEEMARQIEAKQQANEAELSALLGNRYSKWQEYEQASNERQRDQWTRQGREQLRAAVSPAGNALNDAQFDALHAALDAEEKRINEESRGQSMQQELQRMPETHRRLIEVASGHLNAQQLEGYRRHLRQEAEMSRAIAGAMGAAQ